MDNVAHDGSNGSTTDDAANAVATTAPVGSGPNEARPHETRPNETRPQDTRSRETDSMNHGRTEVAKRSAWARHPAVHSEHELTTGQRAADALRNGMGSWPFVLGAIAFLGAWISYNRSHGFDKYPFILLNLVLSCVAALQGAILLIAAKRQDQIASQLALHDYETNLEADQIIKQVHALTIEIHQMMRVQLGVPENSDVRPK